ncbi:hypothetical protein BDV96DRAFT_568340 [Lophiotrema nucula]|uniref:Uncharacterized protein n=1 Tax=Lophiotrema nucula TaxID=690887 RepID=A0A6A5ZHJ0_9PLEO|nr:hypothetical protein BDV96DRAFT_568340 [Lophiotrema nucula]
MKKSDICVLCCVLSSHVASSTLLGLSEAFSLPSNAQFSLLVRKLHLVQPQHRSFPFFSPISLHVKLAFSLEFVSNSNHQHGQARKDAGD